MDYVGNKRHISEHEPLCVYSYFVVSFYLFQAREKAYFSFSLKYIFRLLQYKLCLLFLEAAFAGFYPCFSLFHECLCSIVLAFRSSRKTKADNSPCLLNLEICSLGQLLSLSPYMSESMLWMLSNHFLFNSIKWKFMDIVLQEWGHTIRAIIDCCWFQFHYKPGLPGP